MSVLNVHGLAMRFGERELFSDVTFDVEQKDKIGFIGHNGTGKTTLLKILSGIISPDTGNVFLSKNLVIGHMEQHACSTQGHTVYTELLSVFEHLETMENELERLNILLTQQRGGIDTAIANHNQLLEKFEREGGLTYKSRTRAALIGLGFSENEFEMPTSRLSGGQRSKLSLAKLLLSKSDILLLDEPTNHLDIDSVSWLESFIKGFSGAAIIISHDRYFLDAVTNKTIELENRRIRCYTGNYSEYIRKKKQIDEALENRYKNDLREIKRIEGIIEQQKRFNQAHNYVTAASKQKEVDRIRERMITPEQSEQSMHSFKIDPKRESGSDVFMCEGLSKSFGAKHLFSNVSIHLRKGERVFLLGANGCGKTTLFRLITGELPADGGNMRFGTNVDIGYFDQMQGDLDPSKTAIDWIWDAFPQMTQTQVRTALGSFLFRGDDVFKPISNMSGGERARLSILRLMLRGDNFLLLDEPTNHLDTASREALEETLKNYSGTMLVISHDRYFINKLADRVLMLKPTGVDEYLGNYDYCAEKIREHQTAESNNSAAKPKVNEYKLRKEQQSAERKRRTRIQKIEEEISLSEKEISEINDLLQSDEVVSDYQKLLDLTDTMRRKQAHVDLLYSEWEELSFREQ